MAHPARLRAPAPGRPAPWTGELASWRGLLELALQWQGLARAPGGSGVVVVVPGFGCADPSTALLRAHLRRLGWRAVGWGLGRNHGELARLLPALGARIAALSTAEPVRLVGWSLGGVIARELARQAPERVAQVITLGSPVRGGPRHTALAGRVSREPAELDRIAARADAREAVPIPAPVDVVYARADGVVDWRACIDPLLPAAQHHGVPTTHLGLVVDPVALGTVGALLYAGPRRALEGAAAPG